MGIMEGPRIKDPTILFPAKDCSTKREGVSGVLMGKGTKSVVRLEHTPIDVLALGLRRNPSL